MPTKSKKNDDFKLEFKVDKNGIMVIGNKSGLMKLSQLIYQVAESSEFDHRHLTFDFSEEISAGNFIINLSDLPEPDIQDTQFDITILKSEKIGEQLWDAN